MLTALPTPSSTTRFAPWYTYLSLSLILLVIAGNAQAEVRYGGSVAIEQRVFLEDSMYADQTNSQASVLLAPEFDTELGEGYLSFKPFARIDQRDSERTHVDVRELMYAYFMDDWEVRAGIGRVFWGQTESLHLVDVINQTDLVESIDTEDKLGQPMIDVRYLLDTGAISFYVLPYFRERTFSGQDGRLRGPVPINTDLSLYESDDEQSHIDYAVRWQQSMGDLELGVAYFDGTSRMPTIEMLSDEFGNIDLVPKYNLLQQFSVDALYVYESLLLKLEAIHGKSLGEDFNAYVAGFEYTAVNFYESGYDVGFLAEHQYDEREDQAMITGQNDLMLGARLQLNDFSGSELLVGYVQDLDNSDSYSAYVEGSTRMNQNWRVSVNGYFFSADDEQDPAYSLRRDDHISLNVEYFF